MATRPPPARGPHVGGRGGPKVSAKWHYPGAQRALGGGGGGSRPRMVSRGRAPSEPKHGGPSLRFCTRLPPPPGRSGLKAPRGGGIGGGVQGGAMGGGRSGGSEGRVPKLRRQPPRGARSSPRGTKGSSSHGASMSPFRWARARGWRGVGRPNGPPEGGSEGGREGREGGREGTEGGREGREGGREGVREGGWEGGREGGREGGSTRTPNACICDLRCALVCCFCAAVSQRWAGEQSQRRVPFRTAALPHHRRCVWR